MNDLCRRNSSLTDLTGQDFGVLVLMLLRLAAKTFWFRALLQPRQRQHPNARGPAGLL